MQGCGISGSVLALESGNLVVVTVGLSWSRWVGHTGLEI